MHKTSFKIKGMCCVEEIGLLKREIGPLVGGELNLSFDLLNHKMTVIGAEGSLNLQDIIKAVSRTGMEALVWEEGMPPGGPSPQENSWERFGRPVLCTLSGTLMAAAFLMEYAQRGSLLEALRGGGPESAPLAPAIALVYTGAVVAGVWFVAPRALFALKKLSPDMNLLMMIAVAGAMGLGQWLEAASVSFLFALALLLESWSVGRARNAIKALVDITPVRARFVCPHDGDIEEVPVGDVPLGATVLVRPGEKVPLDGVITKGSTSVNQSPITGESLPVVKQVGDEVYAGTINGEGAFELQSTRAASDTTLARIIHLVEEAQARRAPVEQWVERFARIYTPTVMALALLIAVAPPLLLAEAWGKWIYQALVLLVIACPCSLVISTPVSVVAGLTSAARNGALIKGGAFLEAPARLRAMAFDKTGTLTHGRPTLQKIIPMENHTEKELLAKAAALEMHSTHPLGRAIVREAQSRNIALPPADAFTLIPGLGAQGVIDQVPYWVGNHRLLERWEHETPEIHDLAVNLEDSGHSLVIMWCEDHICGLMSIADEVRRESKEAIRELKDLGLEKIVMITGDHRKTAEEMAVLTGVDDFYAELLPRDKVSMIHALREEYKEVAMVGDGVNDAPAMAAATVSIAMGAMGSDAAIETADIALMTDDVSKIPWLVRHSRRTLRIIRQNIVFSIALKLCVMGLSVSGSATLWMAIAADMGASLVVIFNGLRLLRIGSSPAPS